MLSRAGAEFEVLEAMVHDSSLLLVDAIEVKWNDVFRPEFLEWPAMYSQVIDGGQGTWRTPAVTL
jgi:hypothetical protein